MVAADGGSRDKHAAGSAAPAAPAYLDGARAGFSRLAENCQFADAIDCRKKRNVAGRAKRPCYPNSKLHRRHAGFDAFADR